MDPRPVPVLVTCPRCGGLGEGSVAAVDWPRLLRGEISLPCPSCGTPTKITRKPERPT